MLNPSIKLDKLDEGVFDCDLCLCRYKLQTLLLLEMESAVLSADDSHIEKRVDEVIFGSFGRFSCFACDIFSAEYCSLKYILMFIDTYRQYHERVCERDVTDILYFMFDH